MLTLVLPYILTCSLFVLLSLFVSLLVSVIVFIILRCSLFLSHLLFKDFSWPLSLGLYLGFFGGSFLLAFFLSCCLLPYLAALFPRSPSVPPSVAFPLCVSPVEHAYPLIPFSRSFLPHCSWRSWKKRTAHWPRSILTSVCYSTIRRRRLRSLVDR